MSGCAGSAQNISRFTYFLHQLFMAQVQLVQFFALNDETIEVLGNQLELSFGTIVYVLKGFKVLC